MGRAGPGRVGLAGRAAPDLEAPAVLADRVGLADLEAPAVLADRVGLAGPEDMSRAAQAGTADMARASRVAPASRVDRAALAATNLVVLADRAAPANPVGTSPVIQADQDPGRNRAQLGRNPVHPRRRLSDPDPTRARRHPHPTRAHPHLTLGRPQEQTHPEVATHRPVPVHPAEETHLVGVIRPAEEATHEADAEGLTPHYREFGSESPGFESAASNYIGAQMNS